MEKLKTLLKIFLAIATLYVGLVIYKNWKAKKQRKEEERKQTLKYISSQIRTIYKAVESFFSHSGNFDNGYFTNFQLESWKRSNSDFYNSLSTIDAELFAPEEREILKLFLEYYEQGNRFRIEYNKEFIKYDLQKYSSFFDKVEGRKLDIQQRNAIISDEDNNIVIAGAGSGKTTTIVGKVNYILDRYKVPPQEILLISFTNKSAQTLAERINVPGVEAKTFHKFGKDVIALVEGKQPSIFDENQYERVIQGFFSELIRDSRYLNNVTTFFTNYLKIPKSQDEFSHQGEYYQYLKDSNFSSYKLKAFKNGDRTTYKREVVKSIEECTIANFLFFNNIEYQYEQAYPYPTATIERGQYKPDFTITQNNTSIFLEHFGLNKRGTVPHFFANKGETIEEATIRYTDDIKWKRDLHKEKGTVLLETYSHEMIDEVLIPNLHQRLLEAGIHPKEKNPDEIWNIIMDSAKDEVDSFIKLFQAFIALMKSNNLSIDEVKKKNEFVQPKFLRQRNSLFIELVTLVFQKYQQYLIDRNEIDFTDMINTATQYISEGKFKRKYSYIIIDEFQDISLSRYQLVKAVKNANPYCKLFCVGDDWQSIYRFAGSDISLFKNFEEYFGCTESAKIETTYRFHDPLIGVSSRFILKNPNQTAKNLKSYDSGRSSTYKIIYTSSQDQDDTLALKQIFDELLTIGHIDTKSILVLGRYSFDMKRINSNIPSLQIDRKTGKIRYQSNASTSNPRVLTAQFMTVHKAKGLEAEIVIILNCNAGKHGFPSETTDDPVLNLLLSDADQFENGEERRLFYVALTRTKERVYLIADSFNQSKFLLELESGVLDSDVKKCPRCRTAVLVKRTGPKIRGNSQFYGCSNYIYGCTYTRKI